MTVSGIIKASLIDYPGLVSCVLFVPGCNYDCFYCHNRQLLGSTHDVISPEHVEEFLKKRAGFVDGVVITGGEPTLWPDLVPYIDMIKSLGYKVKLDTNGSMPDVVEQLLESGRCDYYAVDYKAPASRYREICGPGADAGDVIKTIRMLTDANARFEVRTTVIPQLFEDDLLLMAKELPVLPKYVLNRYRKPETFLPGDRERVEKAPYTQQQIESFAQTLRPYQPNIRI